MASLSSQNKKSRSANSGCETTDKDMISDLPGYVLDEILSRLPIKDMVRTSVLSTKWRYEWASVPSLVIDDHEQVIDRIDRVIDHILLLHKGPVLKFTLSCGNREKIPSNEFYKWIPYLSTHSINELIIRIGTKNVSDNYRIPSSLFSCQSLTYLFLTNFSLSLPSAFEGFKNLKELMLERNAIGQKDLEELISRSHVLERLTLLDIDSVDQLNIRGPNLLHVYIRGHLVDVRFENASRLAELYITPKNGNDKFDFDKHEEFGNLRKLMVGIPQISEFMFGSYLMEFMAAGKVPRGVPIPCTNLIRLGVDVALFDLKEVSVLLYLLRSAPNLEKLIINSVGEIVEEPRPDEDILKTRSDAWVWDGDSLDCPLTCLRLVEIHNSMGMKDEMDFVKFVLSVSPALECMTVGLKEKLFAERDDTRNFEIGNTILSFKRSSRVAEIRVLCNAELSTMQKQDC